MTRCVVFGSREAAALLSRLTLAATLAVALVLCGCASGEEGNEARAAQLASVRPVPVVPPALHATDFTTTDALSLPLRKWLPPGEPRAVILALHGFNDYSNAFAVPAKYWAQRGIATYAYDQRGFGGSPGRRNWPGSAALATDAVTAAGILRTMYPHKPLYLLGESMGGAVAILAATGATGIRAAPVDGVVLVAPAVWTRASMQLVPRLALWAGVRMFPGWVLTGQSLHILPSDNIPMLRALAADPMVIKGARIDTIYGLVNLMDATVVAAPRLRQKLLLMYGGKDAVIPPEPVREFVDALPSDRTGRERLAYYPGGYHMLLRDLEGLKIAADVASWALERGASLPSHADAGGDERPWPPQDAGE